MDGAGLPFNAHERKEKGSGVLWNGRVRRLPQQLGFSRSSFSNREPGGDHGGLFAPGGAPSVRAVLRRRRRQIPRSNRAHRPAHRRPAQFRQNPASQQALAVAARELIRRPSGRPKGSVVGLVSKSARQGSRGVARRKKREAMAELTVLVSVTKRFVASELTLSSFVHTPVSAKLR